ncbi:hypothetical protein GCM10023215_67450 [Pseudonocardia yuanmonensis]|uniref:Uncharacterized protein n=1 Tax=Pseudonocardia yuanmonensis TaxID=1095914 RepID=A0ABP8XWD5_9PSEU
MDTYEAEYRRLIRADRRQGPEALLEAVGALGDDVGMPASPREWGLGRLAEFVGGSAALDSLSTAELPDTYRAGTTSS